MTNQPFRFIHAADIHLEAPVNGLAECPEYLEERILDAPRAAMERLFHTALVEKVDFVLLCGDVLAPQQTGPWGILFLIDQFEKLRQEGIQVYWIGGLADSPENIPPAFTFPPNVHLFPSGQLTEFIYQKNDIPLVRILGTSPDRQSLNFTLDEFLQEQSDLYTIGMYYGKVSVERLQSDRIQYWALGGVHRREFLSRSPAYIHYPGATLARNFDESGDYGCSLVEVEPSGRTKITFVKTSPVRWITERMVLRGELAEDRLLSEMQARIKRWRENSTEEITFVSWKLDIEESQIFDLRNSNIPQTLLRELRADFGKESPIVYSLDITPILSDVHTRELSEQQTILGDYLRMLQFYLENPDEKIDIEPFFPPEIKEYLALLRLPKQERTEILTEENLENLSITDWRKKIEKMKTFRKETGFFLELLSLYHDPVSDPKTEGASTKQEDERYHQDQQEWEKQKRTLTLREAALLGIELLSGDYTAARNNGRKGAMPWEPPRLAAERRNLLKNDERKERLP